MFFLSPPFLLFWSIHNFDKIIDSQNVNYQSRYGSLYSEFKNDKGLKSSLFYFIYFLRRIALVIALRYLNNMIVVQKVVHIIFSFVCLAYLVYFSPFKFNQIQLSNLISEVSIFGLFILNLLLSFIKGKDEVFFIEKTFIYIVVICISLQSLIILITFFSSLRRKHNKAKIIPRFVLST